MTEIVKKRFREIKQIHTSTSQLGLETKNIWIRRDNDIQIKETGTEREPDKRW